MVRRIKDFELLIPDPQDQFQTDAFVVTGSSDGSIRVWALSRSDFMKSTPKSNGTSDHDFSKVCAINGDHGNVQNSTESSTTQIGHMLGAFESGHRITCLKAFIMLKSPPSMQTAPEPEWADEFNGIDGSNENSSSTNSEDNRVP